MLIARAVDLQLAHEPDGLVGQAPGDTLAPRQQLLGAHRVVEAHHRHGVHDRREQRARRAADRLAASRRRRDPDGRPPAGAARARAGRSRRRRSPGRRARGSGGCGRRPARSARPSARRCRPRALRLPSRSPVEARRRGRSDWRRLGRSLAPDLPAEPHDPVGDRRRVQTEPAGRRDQAALAQLDGVAPAVDELAPHVRQEAPVTVAALAIGPSVGTRPTRCDRRPRGSA